MFYRNAIFAAVITASTAVGMAQPATMPATSPVTNPATTPTVLPSIISPVERATADAVARLYSKIAAERADGMPLGEILDRANARPRVLAALSEAQQIGGPRELGDQIVQVTLEIRGERAAEIVVESMNADPSRNAISQQQLARSLRRWTDRVFRATGDSHADDATASVNAAIQQAVELPDFAPPWAREAHTASAASPDAGYQLRTARQAEKAAREALRTQLVALQIDPKRTLGASRPTIDAAVAAAKIAGVDYRADGSVEVRVSIDGQQVWQMLQLNTPHK